MPRSNPKPTSDPRNYPTHHPIAEMNTSLIRVATLGSGCIAMLLLASCETTGDPSTGGIFWSEKKAQGRLAERQNKLEHIEKQTNQTHRKSDETKRKIDELQQ